MTVSRDEALNTGSAGGAFADTGQTRLGVPKKTAYEAEIAGSLVEGGARGGLQRKDYLVGLWECNQILACPNLKIGSPIRQQRRHCFKGNSKAVKEED